MTLTIGQKVIWAEIVRKPYAIVDTLITTANLNADQEAWIIEDLELWEAKRNSISVELDGGSDGVSFKTKRLLDEIRIRLSIVLGISLTSEPVVFAGGISVSDMDSRTLNSNRVSSLFTTDLHQ